MSAAPKNNPGDQCKIVSIKFTCGHEALQFRPCVACMTAKDAKDIGVEVSRLGVSKCEDSDTALTEEEIRNYTCVFCTPSVPFR